jgi:glutamyl-tRNA reductase
LSERPSDFVLGVSHRTAPVALRDKLLFRDGELSAFVERTMGEGLACETVVLSTCNRSEIYAVALPGVDPRAALEAAWAGLRGVAAGELRGHGYFHAGNDAVRHLFRVVGSLDSMVLGEMQILGQVKDAYLLASERRWTDFWLDHVFQASFHAGKRIHAETAIHEGAVSVSYAAVELARKVLGDLENNY